MHLYWLLSLLYFADGAFERVKVFINSVFFLKSSLFLLIYDNVKFAANDVFCWGWGGANAE